MCALVLALRKIPIYAPAGGDAVLGSSDKPTYSVTVSDAEAAANREAFAKTKEEKRLVPSKKPEDPAPIETTSKEAAPGVEVSGNRDPATPSTLRYRHSTLNETAALSTLNTRDPAADTAEDPTDLIGSEPHTSGSSTPQDPHRSADLEEVRSLLHRQITRGKRRTTATDVSTGVPSMSETSIPPRVDSQYSTYPPQTLDPYLPQTARYNAPQQQQQPPAPPSGPPPPSQAPQQMQQVPQQIRRPVPGSGNAFAQQAREEQQHYKL